MQGAALPGLDGAEVGDGLAKDPDRPVLEGGAAVDREAAEGRHRPSAGRPRPRPGKGTPSSSAAVLSEVFSPKRWPVHTGAAENVLDTTASSGFVPTLSNHNSKQ